MELCNERFDHHVDYQVLKQNEMKKLAQEAIAQGDKVKYDRKQTQKLNVLLQRAKAPLQRSSYAEETECRRYRAASMSSNRVCSRNGDLPARSREDTYLKCFDANKAELNGEQVHNAATYAHLTSLDSLLIILIFGVLSIILPFKQSLRKGRVKLQVLRSFIINDDGDLEAGNTCADEVS